MSRIADLPPAGPTLGNEFVPIVQGNRTFRANLADLNDAAAIRSESARDAAIAYLNPHPDQAAGEAATAEGELFGFLDAEGEVALAVRTAGGSDLLDTYFGAGKIGFRRGGVDTMARTVIRKLEDVANVFDWMTPALQAKIADRTADQDDAPQIRTDINRAAVEFSAEGGGTLHMSGGYFPTDDNVRLRDDVNLLASGWSSHLDNLATNGFAKCAIVSGNLGDPTNGNSMFDEAGYDLEAIEPGDFKIRLSTIADAANFAIGDIVGIQSAAKWNMPEPRNQHGYYLNQNEVLDVDAATGWITLRYAPPDHYPSSPGARPTLHRLSGTILGYDGLPLWMSRNCGAANLRVTQQTGLTSGWYALFPCGINQHYSRIWLPRASSLIGSNNLSYSSFSGFQGNFEAGLFDFAEWQNHILIEDFIAHRVAANPALNRIGGAVNKGTDILVRRIEAHLAGWGRGVSGFLAHRFKAEDNRIYNSGSVDDTTATEAILLGFGEDCEATGNLIVGQHKYGIAAVGINPLIERNTVPKTNPGYAAAYAPAGVDVITVQRNIFGTEGQYTPADRFLQQSAQSPNARVSGNTGYVEHHLKKGAVKNLSYAGTSAPNWTVLRSTTIKGGTGVQRGFTARALGQRSGVNGTKEFRLTWGGLEFGKVTFGAADTGTAFIEMRASITTGNTVRISYIARLGTNEQQATATFTGPDVTADTVLAIEGKTQNGGDTIAAYEFDVKFD